MVTILRAVLAVLLLSLFAHHTYAMGVTPPRVSVDDISRESSVERSVILSGLEKGSKITTTVSGRGSDWITLPLGESFVSKEEKLSFPFVLEVPKAAANGDYKVKMHIVAYPSEEASGQNTATISAGIQVEFSFSVTGDQIKKYRITKIDIPEIEQGKPLAVVMTIVNEGNVFARPDMLSIAVKDKETGEVAFSGSTTDITEVAPHSTGESIALFQNDLPLEFYFVDAHIHTQNGIQEMEEIPFEIVQVGSLSSLLELLIVRVPPKVENVAKIEVELRNAGTSDTYGTLLTEIYRKDTIVEVLESDPIFVRSKQTEKITQYYTVEEPGDYAVRSQMSFSGRKSNVIQVSFQSTKEASSQKTISDRIPLIAITTCFILVVLFLLRKRS